MIEIRIISAENGATVKNAEILTVLSNGALVDNVGSSDDFNRYLLTPSQPVMVYAFARGHEYARLGPLWGNHQAVISLDPSGGAETKFMLGTPGRIRPLNGDFIIGRDTITDARSFYSTTMRLFDDVNAPVEAENIEEALHPIQTNKPYFVGDQDGRLAVIGFLEFRGDLSLYKYLSGDHLQDAVEFGLEPDHYNLFSDRSRPFILDPDDRIILSNTAAVPATSVSQERNASVAELEQLLEKLNGLRGEDASDRPGYGNKQTAPMSEGALDTLRATVKAAIELHQTPSFTRSIVQVLQDTRLVFAEAELTLKQAKQTSEALAGVLESLAKVMWGLSALLMAIKYFLG